MGQAHVAWEDTTLGVPEIQDVFVPEDLRGRGIGTRSPRPQRARARTGLRGHQHQHGIANEGRAPLPPARLPRRRLPPQRVKGTILIRGKPVDIDDTLLYLVKSLAVDSASLPFVVVSSATKGAHEGSRTHLRRRRSWDSFTEEQRNEVYDRYRAFGEQAGDKVVDGAELASTRSATTVAYGTARRPSPTAPSPRRRRRSAVSTCSTAAISTRPPRSPRRSPGPATGAIELRRARRRRNEVPAAAQQRLARLGCVAGALPGGSTGRRAQKRSRSGTALRLDRRAGLEVEGSSWTTRRGSGRAGARGDDRSPTGPSPRRRSYSAATSSPTARTSTRRSSSHSAFRSPKGRWRYGRS